MLQVTPPRTLASPCINACTLDPARRYCLGCMRTLDEIVIWGQADDDARRGILSACARRRQRQQLGTPADEFENLDEFFPCVGVCMTDAESGYCIGCGRPPSGTQGTASDTDSQPGGNGADELQKSAKKTV